MKAKGISKKEFLKLAKAGWSELDYGRGECWAEANGIPTNTLSAARMACAIGAAAFAMKMKPMKFAGTYLRPIDTLGVRIADASNYADNAKDALAKIKKLEWKNVA
jgi:hypothetical protein